MTKVNNMAKKDKKDKAVSEEETKALSKKELKEIAKIKAGKAEAQAIIDEAKKSNKVKKLKDDEWDEQEGNGGGDFVKVASGSHLGRIRSVISLGQVVFEFDGKKDERATSAMGFVIEVWPYKIKKDKIVLTADKPAIIFHVMKAFKDNDKSHYAKMIKAFKVKNVGGMANTAVGVDIYTSDKGYMYVDSAAKRAGKGIYPLGLLERKAVPELTEEGHLVPNLNAMTKEAMLELNPITQVKDYVLKAINFRGSVAEACLEKIRKDKPKFAMLKDATDSDEPTAKKKTKKKKVKLTEDGEY
jgi:hypothetical protein